MSFPYGLKPHGRVFAECRGELITAEYRLLRPRGINGRYIPEKVLVWHPVLGSREAPLCNCHNWPCRCTPERRAYWLLWSMLDHAPVRYSSL